MVSILASTLLMGLVLLVITTIVFSVRNWRQAPTGGQRQSYLLKVLRNPITWTVGFVIVTLGLVGVSILFLGETPGITVNTQFIQLVMFGGFGLLIGGYFVVGVFLIARSRGMKNSQAALVGSTLVGLIVLAAITIKLVVGN